MCLSGERFVIIPDVCSVLHSSVACDLREALKEDEVSMSGLMTS